MTPAATTLEPADVDLLNAEASRWMKRGIALMDGGRSDMEAALVCFDRALALRSRLPIETSPLLAFGLAACWLNRADVLVRLGDATGLQEAMRAYREGITLLRGLPMDDDPRFPRRMAIGLQNYGLALLAERAPDEAIDAFTRAIEILEDARSAPITDRQYLLAAVWGNLAKARAADESPNARLLARDAARRAVALVAGSERHDVQAAEVGLRARHLLCQMTAARLSGAAANERPTVDDVHEATDLADDGLALVRWWEREGVDRFRPLAYDLFRFGARVYDKYQPQFLQEFILENTAADRSSVGFVESPDMRSAFEEAHQLLSRTGG